MERSNFLKGNYRIQAEVFLNGDRVGEEEEWFVLLTGTPTA